MMVTDKLWRVVSFEVFYAHKCGQISMLSKYFSDCTHDSHAVRLLFSLVIFPLHFLQILRDLQRSSIKRTF